MMSLQAETARIRRPVAYVCPQCGAAVSLQSSSYVCAECDIQYPVLCGIPDFRLESDRYLSLDEERTKATRLHVYSQTHSFAETVAEYYRITDDVPPDMAKRFADYVLAGEARGRTLMSNSAFANRENNTLLDAGCGAGGTVVAAARAGQSVTAIDIALRWLVIAQKRLAEEGLDAELVCGDIAKPPFPDAEFDRILASDLFEHIPDTAVAARSINALLVPGGRLLATGANRFTLASYPPAGLWGVGFMPTETRRRYVVWRRGLDTLRYQNMQTPTGLEQALAAAGFECTRKAPMTVSPDRGRTFGAPKRYALGLYRLLCSNALTRKLLLHVGPVFEITARRASSVPSSERAPS